MRSFCCYIQGCAFVIESFQEYFVNRGKVIFSLVEALGKYELWFSDLARSYYLLPRPCKT